MKTLKTLDSELLVIFIRDVIHLPFFPQLVPIIGFYALNSLILPATLLLFIANLQQNRDNCNGLNLGKVFIRAVIPKLIVYHSFAQKIGQMQYLKISDPLFYISIATSINQKDHDYFDKKSHFIIPDNTPNYPLPSIVFVSRFKFVKSVILVFLSLLKMLDL